MPENITELKVYGVMQILQQLKQNTKNFYGTKH